MPGIIWIGRFLKDQGYAVTENVIFQYNRSAILLENNGKSSSGKRTKHNNIRFFYQQDPKVGYISGILSN